jgi:hypothetical protein
MVLSTFLQLSNVKQTQVCNATAGYFNNTGGTSKGIMTSIETDLRLLEQKHTGSQFYYIAPLTL